MAFDFSAEDLQALALANLLAQKEVAFMTIFIIYIHIQYKKRQHNKG